MHRTVTVVAAVSGAVADVRLDVDAHASLESLLPRLRDLTGTAIDGGVLRNGQPVDPATLVADLTDGDLLVLTVPDGDVPDRPLAPIRIDDAETVHRRLRSPEPDPAAPVVFPPPPAPPVRPRMSLLGALVPLAVGAGVAMLLRRWEFLAFAAMSPLMLLGQASGDRWSARRAYSRARREHAAAVDATEQQLQTALTDERQRREDAAPGAAAWMNAATSRASLLWLRGPSDRDLLRLRVGSGTVPTSLRVEGRAAPTLAGAPVCIDVAAAGLVGVCGAAAVDVVRSLVLQAAVLHGPSTLQITVLAPGHGERWSWARWLPHLRPTPGAAASVALDDVQATERLAELRNIVGCHRLVVVDGGRDIAMAGALAGRARTSVLWLADTEAELPPDCGAVLSGDDPAAVQLRTATDVSTVTAEAVTADAAEQVARSLAPLRDSGAVAAPLPSLVRWSQLYDVPLGEPDAAADALLRRWRHGPSTSALLGVSRAGSVEVDLHRDGPHVLVAGTTGSGKSELLQALVAGLVAGNAPTDLSLLLVDFKGGAAFGACARLPHTTGVLTDLDDATTRRALASLSAELRRREQLLAAAEAPDATSWHRDRRRRGESTGELPTLVIVVDEFAALREELPEFVDGLVGVAQRGRSLGVHLVLATQRPEGAVSADIRANTRLRICLAVAREAESHDLIDCRDAVEISRTTPGRALLRVDAGDLVEVQTARVATPHRPSRTDVTVVPLRDWGEPPRAADATDGPTQLDLLVAAAGRAARQSAARSAVRTWLPPLPDRIALADLPAPGAAAVAIGLLDAPQEQSQPALTVATDHGEPLLLAGGPRSGRTTAALGVVAALAAHAGPDALHVWGVDGGGGLAALRQLPHTGAVIDARDTELAERLLRHLVGQVEQRRRESPGPGPTLLLVVDGWEALVDRGDGRCQELLVRLLAEGGAVGVRVVVTSDRGGLTGRLPASVADKMCFRLADRADYALAGIPAQDVPMTMPPGRAVTNRGLAQLGEVDERTWSRASAWPAPDNPARRFRPLPVRVALPEVAARDPRQVVLGVRGDDLAPVGIDPDDIGSFLVAGPPRSGRTTALVTIAHQLHPRPVVVLAGLTRMPADDPDAAMRMAEHGAEVVADGGVLLVDDVDLIDDVRVLDRVEAAVRSARAGCGFVVVAGATDVLAASFRGPVPQARRARAGLLLQPESPHDGDLLGVRLPRRRSVADPPGRGVLAVHGRAVPVQVPIAG